jgi:Ca-activated chloride channel family protein
MRIGNLAFGAPQFLLLLLLLPAWWIVRIRRKPPSIVFSRAVALAAAPRRGRFVSRTLFVLRNVVLFALIIAAARPRQGMRSHNVTSEGIDIVLTLDVSSSMLALDFLPLNRMDAAKQTAKEFVLARKTDRISLVAFAGEALTQVPLTIDYPVLLAALDNLAAQAGGQLDDGTAIGTAIATSANRLRSAPGQSRVMILLTDGENNRGAIDPRTAAEAASQFGIKIYTIGVGSDGMAQVPVTRGVFGLRYEDRPVRIDERMLREIAASTGGRYYRARDPESLRAIYREIDGLERVPVQARQYSRFAEQFRWPLLIALLAFVLEISLFAWRGSLP